MSADAPPVAREVADELSAAGAEAVVLTGSHARGMAMAESDLDLQALGDGPNYRLERRGGVLVSVSWRPTAAHRAGFDDPGQAWRLVPAWRRALLLHDPAGVAAALQREALAWDWPCIGAPRRDAWAAEELTGYAEEVHKLVNNLGRHPRVAAVQRSVLALRLAGVLAARFELLVESEDELWDSIDARMGGAWARAQSAALGEHGESLDASCVAALELFALAARELAPGLDERQRAVVAHACRLAGTEL